MIARRQLRDDAAVRGVERHLRVHHVRQHAAFAVDDRRPGLVARRLDA
jgi:hypothetical protein